jgi:hypothetical protein
MSLTVRAGVTDMRIADAEYQDKDIRDLWQQTDKEVKQ